MGMCHLAVKLDLSPSDSSVARSLKFFCWKRVSESQILWYQSEDRGGKTSFIMDELA